VNARLAVLERKHGRAGECCAHGRPGAGRLGTPGQDRRGTANSGKFTTLEATDQVKLNPKDKPVDMKPTGTSLLTIQPVAPARSTTWSWGRPHRGRRASDPEQDHVHPAGGRRDVQSGRREDLRREQR
jgi:hypothetical protein